MGLPCAGPLILTTMFYELFLQLSSDVGTQLSIAPVVGAAIIGGATSLLGSIFGGASNSSTNKANFKITKWKTLQDYYNNLSLLNYQFQYNRQLAYDQQLYQKENTQQMQNWQRNMRNEEWDYNSPTAVMDRLRDAGLNPYNSFGSVSGQANSSIASSPGSQVGPSASVGLPSVSSSVIPMQSSGQFYASAFNTIADMIDSIFHDPLTNPNTSSSETKRLRANANLQDTESRVQSAIADNRIEASGLQNDIMKNTRDKLNFDKVQAMWQAYMAEDKAMVLPQELQMQLFTMGANYSNLIKQGVLTDKQAQLAVANALKSFAEATNQRLQNDYFKRASKYMLMSVKTVADIQDEELRNLREYGVREVPQTYEYETKGGVSAGIPGVAGAEIKGGYKGRAYRKRNR